MKVMLVIPTLRAGGAESVVVSLANELSKKINTTLIVVTMFKDVETDYFVSSLDGTIELISLDIPLKSKLKVIFKLYRIFAKYKPDIVHTHLTSLFYSSIPAGLLNISLIHTVHTIPKIEFYGGRFYLVKIIVSLLNPMFIGLTDTMGQSIANDISTNCNVIYNGARDIGNVSRGVNRNCVVVSRLDPVKRHDFVIESFLQSASSTDFELFIVGVKVPGYEDYYSKIADMVRTSPRIHLLEGLSSSKDLAQVFASAQFIILCSKYEGLPISLLEGMSTGLIPLATPTPGLIDFFQDNNLAGLSADNNLKQFTDLLQDSFDLKQSAVMERESTSKMIFKSKYSSEKMAVNYVQEYQKIIGNKLNG